MPIAKDAKTKSIPQMETPFCGATPKQNGDNKLETGRVGNPTQGLFLAAGVYFGVAHLRGEFIQHAVHILVAINAAKGLG